ncbi:MAG: hypothetical protein WCI56_08185 [Hyphomicrobiales bacterium]
MSDQSPHQPGARLFTLDSWAVAAAAVFILLIVAGVLPRVPW